MMKTQKATSLGLDATIRQERTVNINQCVFDDLPHSAFVRESQLVRSPKRPQTPVPLPFSAPTLWRKVSAGTFPKPIKLSERVTCWRVSEVRAWMADQIAA